jgi:hypothetical protein
MVFTVIPMTTAGSLPEHVQEGRMINRMTILTSRDHPDPGSARDGLADWALRNDFDAVIGVSFLAIPEVVAPGQSTTVVKWAAYGTAIGWRETTDSDSGAPER